ncbi:hypothetical protein [Massilia sp. GCM10023247]|uniref:hypothetical protein n=1 Tax=Massilia sp. GCM10023247 TaxID=3252643 RepID=UPI0036221F59
MITGALLSIPVQKENERVSVAGDKGVQPPLREPACVADRAPFFTAGLLAGRHNQALTWTTSSSMSRAAASALMQIKATDLAENIEGFDMHQRPIT